MPHFTTGKNGIERIHYERFKNAWVCSKCGAFTGYTHTIEEVIRYAFCRICDEQTKQISTHKGALCL